MLNRRLSGLVVLCFVTGALAVLVIREVMTTQLNATMGTTDAILVAAGRTLKELTRSGGVLPSMGIDMGRESGRTPYHDAWGNVILFEWVGPKREVLRLRSAGRDGVAGTIDDRCHDVHIGGRSASSGTCLGD